MRPRSPRDLHASARRTRGRAQKTIARSATTRPRVERARLPLPAKRIIYFTGPETAARDHGRFARLFGQFVLAISTAAITAFLIFGIFASERMHGPSTHTPEGDSTEPQLIASRAAAVGTDSIAHRETPNSQATSAPLRRLDREEISYLLKRGAELVAAGELGLARHVLRRAAEARDPNAAFALATTYDPIVLEARRVIGVAPDTAMARAWYEKAKEFGSTDASRRLELLASGR